MLNMWMDGSYLKQVLDYDPTTGYFTWRKRPIRRNWAFEGKRAGNLSKRGYIDIAIDGKVYKAHRLAWLYMTGSMPSCCIDHINGDKSDNSFSNLREATYQQNHCNKGPQSNNKSGYKGVYLNSRRGTWCAEVKLGNKRARASGFASPEEAALWRSKQAEILHGEFAWL